VIICCDGAEQQLCQTQITWQANLKLHSDWRSVLYVQVMHPSPISDPATLLCQADVFHDKTFSKFVQLCMSVSTQWPDLQTLALYLFPDNDAI